MAHRLMFVSALLQGSCSCLTLLPCTQPQLSLTTCSLSYCARYQRRPIAMNETSLHGRDLEGLVRVATGLLASRDISRCRREDQAGPRPTDLSAARDFFPSGQYPGYRIPSLIHRLVPSPFFFSSRESRPHEQWIWSMS